MMNRRVARSRRSLSSGALVVCVLSSVTFADEDWHKLVNLLPPYLGPGLTGRYITSTPLGEGDAPRGPTGLFLARRF